MAGSGLTPNLPYYIWVRIPTGNGTTYSGITFNALSSGLIPPAIAIPLSANPDFGTYLVSLSTSAKADTSQVTAHFGVWGTTKPLYQRTESVKIMGGGLFAGTSFKLTVRNPAGNYLLETSLASTAAGDFNDTWRIPEDSVTDVYSVFIDGTGSYDNPQQDYVSQAKFTVTPAVLSVSVSQQPDTQYQRTEQAKVSLGLQYPDGSPVVNVKSGITPVVLLQNQTTAAVASLALTDSANGIWGASVKIPLNESSGKYRFELPATSFDDGFGNKGGTTDTYSNYFQIGNASLAISIEVNGTQIQIPFGQVSIISKVTYPDGTPMTNGTVMVDVSTGSSVSELQATYDPTIQAWRASYSSKLADLFHVGTWSLKVDAVDTFGNSGTASYDVTAQLYLFLVLVAVIVAAALFARWTVSRYGRRVYFRARKIIQRFRPSTVALSI